MQTRGLTSKSKAIDQIACQRYLSAVVIFLYLIALACLSVSNSALAQEGPQVISARSSSQPEDPNKGPSEFNHHIAGWALIGVGLLALTSLFSPTSKPKSYVWPALFVLAGFFLALWSDGEIWPRGNVSWFWLFHHDAEARQHKVYSLLLVAIGTVEYIRIRGSLPRFWRRWAFPLIAIVGAGMLLVHDHSSGSGVHSPEVQAYLVDPGLDVDGNPRGLSLGTTLATGNEQLHQSMLSCCDFMSASTMDTGHMQMDHSQMDMHVSSANPVSASHHHLMTASMLLVERQHLWFMIVGLAIVLFKFFSDSELFRSRVVPCIWPSCTMLLGVLLILYRE
jgi:cell division protein FtsW (lipid II flippase)